MTAQSVAYQWSLRVGGQTTALRLIGLTAALAAAAAAMAAPIRADMMGNAFLSALANAGVSYSQPASALAAGQSVCPMLIQPGGDFDEVVSKMAAGNGLSEKNAGIFTIIAIATYCPSMLAPLLPNRLQA
jgi:Protein of unknown function (DUF732)